MSDPGAYILREMTGTNHVAETLRRAVELLAHWDIPHWVVGGLAVQEHGYYRVTTDVDLVVSDVEVSRGTLVAHFSNTFKASRGFERRVVDRRTDVSLDLLPGGGVLDSRCPVPFPLPTIANELPQYVSLEQLISLKLGSFMAFPMRRLRDKTDVVELIVARNLPRDLNVHRVVRAAYEDTWDALQSEGPGPRA